MRANSTLAWIGIRTKTPTQETEGYMTTSSPVSRRASLAMETRALPSRPGPSQFSSHIGAIDGLRGIAVLGVLGFHLSVLQGGFLGVDLFFVISGYVITRLILRQRTNVQRFSIFSFWGRRIRRLLPAVLAVVLVTQLWIHAVNPVGIETAARGQALSSLVYGTNWYNIFAGLNYWDASASLSPLNHLWSLAIEEQFYIVWPLVLLLLPRQWMIAVAATLGIMVSACIPFTFGSGWSLDRLYQGTDTRVIALLGGVLLSTALTKVDKGWLRRWCRRSGGLAPARSVAKLHFSCRRRRNALAVVRCVIRPKPLQWPAPVGDQCGSCPCRQPCLRTPYLDFFTFINCPLYIRGAPIICPVLMALACHCNS